MGLPGKTGGTPGLQGEVGPEESSCVHHVLEKMRVSFRICVDGPRTALRQEEWSLEGLIGKERVQLPEERHQKIRVISMKGNRTSLFLLALRVTKEYKRSVTIFITYEV